jgi:hypothetical protein
MNTFGGANFNIYIDILFSKILKLSDNCINIR